MLLLKRILNVSLAASVILAATASVALPEGGAGAEQFREFELAEPFGVAWPEQMVSRELRYAEGACHRESLLLIDVETGKPVPHQLSEEVTWGESKFLRNGVLSWRADLPANETRTWRLAFSAVPRRGPPATPTALKWTASGSRTELSNGRIAVALPKGGETDLQSAKTVPAPILSLKGPDGAWFGRGEWASLGPVWGKMRVTPSADGPIFAEATVSYLTVGGQAYRARVRVPVGEDYALVYENCAAKYHARGGWSLVLSDRYAPDRVRDFQYYQAQPPKALSEKPGVIAHLRPWTFAQILTYRDYLGVQQAEGRKDAIGLMAINGSTWRRGHGGPYWPEPDFSSRDGWLVPDLEQAVQLVREVGGDLSLRVPLCGGERVTGIAIYDKSRDRGRYVIEDLRHETSETPLSDVLGMVLDWKDDTPRPHLYGDERTFELVRKNVDLKDPWFTYTCAEFKALVTKDTSKAEALRKSLVDGARKLASYWTPPETFEPEEKEKSRGRKGYVGTGLRSIEVGPQARNLAGRYDLARALGILTEQEGRLVRSALAFAAYKFSDPEFFAPLCALGNFKVDGYFSLAVIALTFPEHPHSEVWLAEALRQFSEDLDEGYYLYESGAGNECEIYRAMSVNFFTQLAMLLRVHGRTRWAEHPRLAGALRWLLEFSVPPVPKASYGLPRVLPFDGDTTTTTPPVYGLFGMGAVLLQESDPELSKWLAWAWKQAGQAPFRGHGINNLGVLNYLNLKKDLPAGAPTGFASKAVPGYGFVFHRDWGKPTEWMVFGKAGKATGHYHPSDGSIQIYAHGKPLVIGYGKYPYITTTWRYTTVRLDGRSNWSRGRTERVLTSESCDAAEMYVPVENVSRDLEKSIPELVAGGQIYQSTWDAVMDVPRSHFERSVIFDRIGGFVVVYDRAGPRYSSDWFTHVLSESNESDGEVTRFKGKLGVDLDLHVLLPAKTSPKVFGPIATQYAQEIKDRKLRWPSNNIDQQVVQLSAPPDSDYLTVFHPRAAASPGKPLETARRDKVWQVDSEAGSAFLVCEREAASVSLGEFRFDGRRGCLLRHGKRKTLVILDGTQISDGALGLTAEHPTAFIGEARDGKWLQMTIETGSTTAVEIYGAGGHSLESSPKLEPTRTPEKTTFLMPPGRYTMSVR